jgi:hypothetical protein
MRPDQESKKSNKSAETNTIILEKLQVTAFKYQTKVFQNRYSSELMNLSRKKHPRTV